MILLRFVGVRYHDFRPPIETVQMLLQILFQFFLVVAENNNIGLVIHNNFVAAQVLIPQHNLING